MFTLLKRLNASLHAGGWGATLLKIRALIVDRWFDLKYGLDTCTVIPLKDLHVAGENKERGYLYQPARVLGLRTLFHAIKHRLPAASVAVDFGSGKGRVLMICAEFGMREVRGVEFAHELCAIARQNLVRYKASTGVASRFSVIEGDAALYRICPEENIFILCNPFDDKIVGLVLDNIAESIQRHPRNHLVIYCNPRWHLAVVHRPGFVQVQEVPFPGFDFRIYSFQPSATK